MLARYLGVQPYTHIWQAMQQYTAERNADSPDEIWLLEHPPVYTQGQAGQPQHLLRTNDIPLVHSDRGGQITYHAPGQLIAYVLCDIRRLGYKVRQFVTALECALIDLLADYQITGQARADAPGVYVAGAKIASLGLRIRRGYTYHGLSLNIDLNLAPFADISPCGYPELAVTQLREFGIVTTSEAIAPQLAQHLGQQLGYHTPLSLLHLPWHAA